MGIFSPFLHVIFIVLPRISFVLSILVSKRESMDEVSTDVLRSTYIPDAIPTEGRFPLVILGSKRKGFDLVFPHTDPRARLSGLLANHLPSILTERRIQRLVKDFPIPSEVHLLVAREIDWVLTPSVGYCNVYTMQLRVGLRFPLLPLLTNILLFYNLQLSHLVPNAVMMVLALKRHY